MAGTGQKAARRREGGGGQAASEGGGGVGRRAGRSPGAQNQALQSLLSQGRGTGPTVHQGHTADAVLGGLGARGAAVGQNILLSRSLGGAERQSVLRHEMRHVEQVSGRDANPAAPLTVGPRGDRWEKGASGQGNPGQGADPQVIRRDDPPDFSGGEAEGVCVAQPASTPDADTSAGTCDIDEDALFTESTEPLTSAEEIELSSDPSQHVCAAPYAMASFDPESIDVPGMRNDTLNSESIRVDGFVDLHGNVSPRHPDLGAYQRLQARLRAERAARVQSGHMWMTTALDQTPGELLMLQASSGETVIIRVDMTIANGVPTQSFPGPIMTRQQFDDHMAGLGIPILTEEEYIERLRQTARELAPHLLMSPQDMAAQEMGLGPAFNPNDPFGIGGATSDPLGLGPFATMGDPLSDFNRSLAVTPFTPRAIPAPYDPGGIDLGLIRPGSDDDRIRGYYGGQGRLDPRTQSHYDTLPWRRTAGNARAGETGEGRAVYDYRRHGVRGFESGRFLWNARGGSSRVWPGGGGGTPYRVPEGVDPLLPVRRGRDATAAVDFRTRSPVSLHEGAPGYDLFSVKTSFGTAANPNSAEANRVSRHGVYFDELAALSDTSRNNLRLFRDAHYPDLSLDEVAGRMALMVPEHHAQEMRDVLRNPTGYETTNSGRRARLPRWAMDAASGPRNLTTARMRPHFANAEFPPFTVGLPQGVRTGADLHRHFQGDLDNPEFRRLMNVLGESLAARVHGFDLPENVVRWHQSYRESLPGNRAVNLRAAGIETARWLDVEQRMAGDADVYTPDAQRRARALNRTTIESGGRSAVMGGGFSLAQGLIRDPSRYDDPELWRRAGVETAMEGVVGGIEQRFNARVGREILESGLETSIRRGGARVLASRVAGRALPGLADVGMEIYDMSRNGREESTAEIVTRTGRAAVIGGGAAWAGAAAGTAVGGPVGFVVGLGVGLLVGWLANELTPGGAEYWDRQHAAEQRRLAREAEARRRAEHERRMAALRARIERLSTPLNNTRASSVGVEGLFALPYTNPDLMMSREDLAPTIGELEREYLLTVLRMSDQPAQ